MITNIKYYIALNHYHTRVFLIHDALFCSDTALMVRKALLSVLLRVAKVCIRYFETFVDIYIFLTPSLVVSVCCALSLLLVLVCLISMSFYRVIVPVLNNMGLTCLYVEIKHIFNIFINTSLYSLYYLFNVYV